MPEQIQQLENRIKLLENLVFAFVKTDKYYFSKHIVLADGLNIALSTGTGTRIGTGTGQKIGFFNVTPVVQQANIVDPSGGATIDTEARTAINSILDVLDILGFTA